DGVMARRPTSAKGVSVVAAPGPFHQRRPSVRALRRRLPRRNAFVPYVRRRGHAPSHAERDRDGRGNRSASNARLIRRVRMKILLDDRPNEASTTPFSDKRAFGHYNSRTRTQFRSSSSAVNLLSPTRPPR